MSKEMSAEQQTVSNVLSSSVFHIPYYQRPYSWDEEQCETLWDDFYQHFDEGLTDPYFLGVIVLAVNNDDQFRVPDNNDLPFDVIDGQQRLTTLSLLLRSLLIEEDNEAMKKCLYRLNEEKNDVIAVRFKSDVLGGTEQQQLEKWLNRSVLEPDFDSKVAHEQNYAFFRKQVFEYFKDSPDRRKEFASFVRNRVILLRVVCRNEDKALTIFETINNRGKNLTDGDIFKAKLAQLAIAEKSADDFSKRWDGIAEKIDWLQSRTEPSITLLFRYYMHLLRGWRDDRTKTVGLRDFFDGVVYNVSKKKEKQNDYKLTSRKLSETMDHLERIVKTLTLFQQTTHTGLQIWNYILDSYKNDIWKYPVVSFLYGHVPQNDIEQFDDDVCERCCRLMRNIARYIFAKGFGSTSIRGASIEDALFTATVNAAKGEIFSPSIEITDQFMQKFNAGLSVRFQRAFSAIIEFVTLERTKKFDDAGKLIGISEFRKDILEKSNVEHILPKNWSKNHYEEWNAETVKPIMDTIGNVMLLESRFNIGGSDRFFSEKLSYYRRSSFNEAQLLAKESIGDENYEWTQKRYQERHERCKRILREFFEGKDISAQD